MFGAAESPFQDQFVYGPASLRIVWDTTYNPAAHPSMQTLQDANIHLDNDFGFVPTGLPECSVATLAGTTTAAAIAACPTSVLGLGGNATFTGSGGSFGAAVTSFNGPASVVYLHVRIGPPVNVTLVSTGTIGTSTRGGDFGNQIFFVIPDTVATGLVLTHMDARFDIEPEPGHFFFTARCFDPDRYWNYLGDFAFRSGGGLFTAQQVQQCNLRSVMSTTAAVTSVGKTKKKCKKKPRKRCKKKP